MSKLRNSSEHGKCLKSAALRNVSTGPGGMALRRLTSLVDAAGEALGLTEDPLNTIVGEVSSIKYMHQDQG